MDGEGQLLSEDGAAAVAACPEKPTEGNRKIRAQFGRKCTHNEQVIVALCGMIIARATFYNAEAVSSVVELVKRTYRDGPYPEHMFFDNNCHLAKTARRDHAFDNMGLSVDVFHFNCKHNEKDTYCLENCNPRAFPELIREDGGWYFNSSIAEQTNVWLGGYLAICREMHVDKYNLFLDEMVLRRNKITRGKLEQKGKIPRAWRE